MPNKINKSLEIGQISDDDWNNINKLSSLIYSSIKIEENIKIINNINENIKIMNKFNDFKINFTEEKTINEFIQKIKLFGNININLPKYFENSLILQNQNDLFRLILLSSNKIEINTTALIYRSSRDGNSCKSIMEKLTNKSNLIFIYLTGNERIFGNYVKTKLENLVEYKNNNNNFYSNYYEYYYNEKNYKDENAFVFSLNNNRIYTILKPEYAIRFSKKKNRIFIGNNENNNGFYLSENKINDEGLLNEPKIYDFENKNELTEGKNKLNELEIYEIS